MSRTELLAILALVCVRGSAQTGITAISSTPGQPTIRLESKLAPETPSLTRDIASGTASRDKRFQRFLYDKATHEYFGYSLTLERVSSSETRITFGPLSLNPAEQPISDPSARLMPSPAFPPPQIVHFREKVAIDFFENPKTGQKIVDYVWLERPSCDGERQKADCLQSLLADANTDLQRLIQEKIAAAVNRRIEQEIEDRVQKRIDEKMQKIDQKMQKREEEHEKKRSLERSQQSWEMYRDETCGVLPDASQQVDCKLKLTRSRIRDVQQIY